MSDGPGLPAAVRELLHTLERPGAVAPTLTLRGDVEAIPGLAAWTRWLAGVTGGRLALLREAEGSPPGLAVRHGEWGEVALWSAVPEGPEALPFLEFLAALCSARGSGGPGGPGDVPGIRVLVAAGCPHCPHAVRAAARLVAEGRVRRLHVVDVALFPAEAERLGITSVPVTLAEGLVLAGVRPVEELARELHTWGTPEWEERVLAAHLDEGRLEAAARRLERGGAARAFAALWGRSSFSERLGLMLAARTALERAPRALDDAVAELVPHLEEGEAGFRGDTADLLGSLRHPGARPALERLAADPDPELAEVAQEALERLSGGGDGMG